MVENMIRFTAFALFSILTLSAHGGAGEGGASQVVINEIHCDHENKTLRVEFIEIYNRGLEALDLSGWFFDRGVDYTFPAGSSIAPGAYVVVAENPAVLKTTYGYTTTYGPWTGTLKTSGETIRLCLPDGKLADIVDFGQGFPWPTTGVAPNYSLELINPSLDNDLGGNWRSKAGAVSATNPEVALVAPASTTWRMRRGNFEVPAGDWAALNHVEDGFWENATTALSATTGFYQGIGFADNDDATSLAAPLPVTPEGVVAMQSNYRSVYLRQNFQVNAADIRGNLKLRVYADDGAVVYLNNVEVPQRFSVGTGTVGHNGDGITVSSFEAAPNNWREMIIPNMSGWINPGANVIAVHGLNDTLGGNDFSLNVELRRTTGTSGSSPTPGAVNSVSAANAGPAIRQVEHAAVVPVAKQQSILPGQDVIITAKVSDPQGVKSVELRYQIVEPGSYITMESGAYELAVNWTSMAMRDDGTASDATAGDGIYSAVIPASVQTHRRLVRYRLIAIDLPGEGVRAPYHDDPQPNFAYFVYGSIPDYTAAINPDNLTGYTGSRIASHTTTLATYPGSMLAALPTYQLITTRKNHVDAQYIPGPPNATNPTVQFRGDENANATDEQSYPWLGTMVYEGKVYDHIRFRARGGVWRYSMGKNMWKFDMSRGHDFQSKDNFGRSRDEKWKKINFSSGIQQGDFLNRGEHALYEAAGFRLFQLTGLPANHTNYVHFRIIEHANETGPTANQYDDDFQGLYLAIEQEDGQMLKEHGLPDGNLYKMEGGSGVLNNQGPSQPSNKSDLNSFMAYSNQEAWWRQNVHLPQYYNYRAIMDCVHHYDTGDGKNYFYYHYPVIAGDPRSNKWQAMVWDLDLIWADNMYRSDSGIAGLAPSGNSTEPFFSRLYAIQPLRTEMRNRHREILDLLWNQEQTSMVMDELASFIYQPGVPSAIGADRAMWDYNPIMASSFVNSSKAGRGRFYQSAVNDPATPDVNEILTFPGIMQKMRNYITTRRTVITNQILTDESGVPTTPVISRAGGETTIPVNDLTFTATDYNSPSSSAFTHMKWRIAAITDPKADGYNRWDKTTPRKYEIDAANTWESPELAVLSTSYTFPAATARHGLTYRVRVRYADSGNAANGNTPRWGHWSAPLTFNAVAPEVKPYLDGLVISEVMYHARGPSPAESTISPDSDDYEYVVVQNVGTSVLDMSPIRFTKGIDFDFAGSAITNLQPGQRAVVVKNAVAFKARYPSLAAGASIAGAWKAGDSLSSSGEQIKLSFGAGTGIRDFTYDDAAPWPVEADGAGYSLVLIAPWKLPDHASAANWRLSASVDGSPGGYDGVRLADWKTQHNQTVNLDDPDMDGIPNLLEYPLSGDPSAPSPASLPTVSMQPFPGPADPPYLMLSVRLNRAADDVLVQPELSADGTTWGNEGISLVSANLDAGTGLTTWQWRSNTSWPARQRGFFRLRAMLR